MTDPREALREIAAPMVMVVEDEPRLARFIATGLRGHGYRVVVAASAAEASSTARQHLPDLVLLDLGLPDLDGKLLIPALRREGSTPVIVLSARHGETEKIAALDVGADDYVTKPFGFEELLARIRVALRRSAQVGQRPRTVFECGPLRVDLEARRVTVQGNEIHLTPIEYKLLVTLVRHAGRVVTHRILLQEGWGLDGDDRKHYVRVCMTHLRRKLERDPSHPRLLFTASGVGYRLASE